MKNDNEKLTERESPNKYHQKIPGNPTTATSSTIKLNDRSNKRPLRVLTEEDWEFWTHNGYIVIKNYDSLYLKKNVRQEVLFSNTGLEKKNV